MRILSDSDLVELIPAPTLVATLEQGLKDFAAGKVQVPERQHLDFAAGTILTMPCAGPHALGTKIVAVIPSNPTRNLPAVTGLMVLCDGVTAEPLAVMSAARLTALRTGALGALSLKYTTPPQLDSIGVIGIGVQGTWQAIFARAVRELRTIFYLTRSEARIAPFEQALARHAAPVHLVRCADSDELLARTDVIIAATTSSVPVLRDRPTFERKHFLSVGSFKASMQEFPDGVYRSAGHIVIDSDAARSEAGDVAGPLARGAVGAEAVFHLAELVSGRRSVDTRRTTAVKSVGSALYDLYAAQALHAEAQRLGRGVTVNL